MSAAMDMLDSLVVDRDGTRWGDRAVALQRADAEALLDLDGPRRHWIGRSRGYSKSDDLAAISIAVLLKQLGAGDTALVCAADRDQAKIIIDRIRWTVKRTPGLSRLLKVSQYDVVAKSGAKLEAISADAASSWGQAPRWAICDELARWPETEGAEEFWQSISSAAVKLGGRLAVITTASIPAHWTKQTVYDHAVTEPAWRVSETHEPAPWIDPEELAAERRRLPQAIYEQLWENRWVAAAGSFLDPALIDAAFTLPGPRLDRDSGFKYFAGLDIGLVNDLTAFAIGHRDGDTIYLDRLETWQGSQDSPVDISGVVEPFIVEQHQRFHFELQLDPWQGMDLAARLKARGLKAEIHHFSTGSKQKLAQTLLSAINHGALRLYPAEGLRDELIALRLVQNKSTGAWSFDHTRKGHDDRATALGLMAAVALEQSGGQGLAFDKFYKALTRFGSAAAIPKGYFTRSPDAPPPTHKELLEEASAEGECTHNWLETGGGFKRCTKCRKSTAPWVKPTDPFPLADALVKNEQED